MDVYALRRRCVRDARSRQLVFTVALAMLGGAVGLAQADIWPWPFIVIALTPLVFWAGGWFVPPFGPDAYAKRLQRIERDWFEKIKACAHERSAISAARIEELEQLVPQAEAADDHAALLTLAREAHSPEHDTGEALPDRYASAAAAAAHLVEIGERWSGTPYGAQLVRLGERHRDAPAFADLSRTALGRLHHVRPWRPAEAEHRALIEAYHVYADALDAAVSAIEGRDPSEARESARRMREAADAASACRTALSERLGLERRWGRPRS